MSILSTEYQKNGSTFQVKVGYSYKPGGTNWATDEFTPAKINIMNVHVLLDGKYRAIKPSEKDMEQFDEIILRKELGQ